MNRQNFLGHLAMALTLILLAGFAGQLRRWKHNERLRVHTDFEFAEDQHVDGNGPDGELRSTAEGKARIFVRFRPGTLLSDIREIALNRNDVLEDEIESVDGLTLIGDEDGLDTETVLSEYQSLPNVEYAEPVFEINADHGLPGRSKHKHANDEMFSRQWSLENVGQNGGVKEADIKASRAWVKSTGSRKIVVAVLDSGVDYSHADLKNNMWKRPANVGAYFDDELGEFDDVNGYNVTDRLRDPMDDNGHGTHCAGIIGAEGNNGIGITGINWQVEIMPVKILSSTGSGTTREAIEGINYVIERKRAGVNVRIINASWGSTQKSRALQDALKRAGDEGIIIMAAAGNAAQDSDRRPHYPAGYDLPNLISVAALNRSDALAGFSNYGATSVHVAAPGQEILSTWLKGQYKEANGTSMATPEVSGVAALVLSTNPRMTVKELRKKLLDSVDKLDSLKGKVSSGGRINAAKAVGAE